MYKTGNCAQFVCARMRRLKPEQELKAMRNKGCHGVKWCPCMETLMEKSIRQAMDAGGMSLGNKQLNGIRTVRLGRKVFCYLLKV